MSKMKHSRPMHVASGHTGSPMGAQHPRHNHDNVNVKRGPGVTHRRSKPRPKRQHGRKAR